ncbi:MAG TPA: hypothetical protein VKA10_03485, partial [Prolixibacteraceae bacterium]|nr:hypothetical protein [Prolixibacteraceae bacterium]
VMNNTKTAEGKSPKNAQHRFYSNIGSAKDSAKYIKFYDSVNIWNCIDAIERVHNSVIIVDRVAAKTKTEIGGESSGITNNVDEFMENVTNLLDKISKSEFDNDSEFKDLETSISKIRSDVKLVKDKQDILNMQHTFLFAIDEIRENLKITNDFFEKA